MKEIGKWRSTKVRTTTPGGNTRCLAEPWRETIHKEEDILPIISRNFFSDIVCVASHVKRRGLYSNRGRGGLLMARHWERTSGKNVFVDRRDIFFLSKVHDVDTSKFGSDAILRDLMSVKAQMNNKVQLWFEIVWTDSAYEACRACGRNLILCTNWAVRIEWRDEADIEADHNSRILGKGFRSTTCKFDTAIHALSVKVKSSMGRRRGGSTFIDLFQWKLLDFSNMAECDLVMHLQSGKTTDFSSSALKSWCHRCSSPLFTVQGFSV